MDLPFSAVGAVSILSYFLLQKHMRLLICLHFTIYSALFWNNPQFQIVLNSFLLFPPTERIEFISMGLRGNDMKRCRLCERKSVVYTCEWHTVYLVGSMNETGSKCSFPVFPLACLLLSNSVLYILT